MDVGAGVRSCPGRVLVSRCAVFAEEDVGEFPERSVSPWLIVAKAANSSATGKKAATSLPTVVLSVDQ